MRHSFDGSVSQSAGRLRRFFTPIDIRGRRYIMTILIMVSIFNSVDRFILAVLMEPIKHEFGSSDSMLGILAGAFSVFYILAGVPFGLAADRFNRRNLLAGCLAFWSMMTALCGMVQNSVQLVIARIGVGIGEAGGGPAGFSMVSDLYPEAERARGMSLYYVAMPIGSALAFWAGSWIAAEAGWRATFIAAAVPGTIIALLLVSTVGEPARGQSDVGQIHADRPTFSETVRFIWSQRSLRHLILGLALLGYAGNGAIAWSSSFLIRLHHFSIAEAGLWIGAGLGPLAAIGIIFGGKLSDRAAEQGSYRRSHVLAAVSATNALAFAVFVLAPVQGAAIVGMLAWLMMGALAFPSAFALCHSLVPPRMRGIISALTTISTAAGAVAAPAIGVLSDHLVPNFSSESLRYALMPSIFFYGWAAMHFHRSAQYIEGDRARLLTRV